MKQCPKCNNCFSLSFIIGKYLGFSHEYWFCPKCNACLIMNAKTRFYTALYFFLSMLIITFAKISFNNQYAYIVFLALLFVFLVLMRRVRLFVLRKGFIVKHHDKEKLEFYSYDEWEQIKVQDEYDIISEEK